MTRAPDLEFASNPEDRCIPDKKAPFFDIVWNEDGSALEQGYFDITNSFVATPGTEYLEGYGEIPSCWLFANPADECVATMYFVRNSFWLRVPEHHDYEPMPYSGAISDQFGYFAHDYLTYDQQTAYVSNYSFGYPHDCGVALGGGAVMLPQVTGPDLDGIYEQNPYYLFTI